MNDILFSIIYPFIGMLLIILVGALAYFIKRFIDGQDKMNGTLTTISERMGSMEVWARMQEQLQNDRHEDNKRSIEALWEALGDGK